MHNYLTLDVHSVFIGICIGLMFAGALILMGILLDGTILEDGDE